MNTKTMELNGMFIYTLVPIRREVVEKYIHGFMSNDREKWHKHWEQNNQTKHEDMPAKAWPMLDKWWSNPKFKRENETMKNKRLLALDSSNYEFLSSQQSEPTSKKKKSSFNLVGAAKDFEGIFYSDDKSP